jgi:hypothetical protein
MPLMPSALCDPSLYLNRLDAQMRAVLGIVDPKAWQAYLSTEELLPYVRSVAAGRIAEMDNVYQRLSAHTQSPGIWRSIADGVSDRLSELMTVRYCHTTRPFAEPSSTKTAIPICRALLARTGHFGLFCTRPGRIPIDARSTLGLLTRS